MGCTGKDVFFGFKTLIGILFFLYFFLVSLDLLGSAFKVLAGDSAGSLFDAVSNPIAGVMVGVLATVMVQSSSTTTSVIVSIVGTGVLPVQTAIPMIMGANIGTSVTNTIVSFGFVANRDQLRRGFSGATVHDMFNYLNVAFWLPFEEIINAINGGDGGVLFLVSDKLAQKFEPCDDTQSECEAWTGPFKVMTAPIVKNLISADKDVTKDFAKGRPEADMCKLLCENTDCIYKFNQKRCVEGSQVTVSPEKMECALNGGESEKAQFQWCLPNDNATADGSFLVDQNVLEAAQTHYDAYKINKGGVFYDKWDMQESAGWLMLVFSLILLSLCLFGLVKVLSAALTGTSEGIVKKALNVNGYLAIIIGAALTMLVQSSSVTTSALTPLVALGTLELESMLPLTLGANIGTTLTGILASMVGDSRDSFQIAMVHVFFNVFGVLMWYPIPAVRNIPLRAARNLGALAARFRAFPLFYLLLLFAIYPGSLLAISVAFGAGTTGGTAGGVLGVIFFIGLHGALFFWYHYRGGAELLEKYVGHKFDDEKVLEEGDIEEPAKPAKTSAPEGSSQDGSSSSHEEGLARV